MHMKRYSMPGFWPLGRKVKKFVTTPLPGPHGKYQSIPLRVLVRDVLKYANTTREAKAIIKSGEVMIDRKVVKEEAHPVGLMDVVELKSVKKHYRVMADHRGLMLTETSASEASKKLCRVKGKKIIRGGRLQISLHDGRCIIVGKENKYKPGDSVLIELPGQKILHHWQVKVGSPAMIVSGKNIGKSGRIKSIYERKRMQEKSRIVIETKKGEIETLRDYVLVGEVK